MKKILIILATIFTVSSCCSNDNTEDKPVYTKTSVRAGVDCYDVYRIKIENHTYIMMTCHYRMGLEHDPECPCHKEK